jgi:transposase-like protein
MREGTELSYEELRAEARQAVEASGKAYAEVARELDVHRTAVARAVKEEGEKFQRLQREIIQHLTPYRIERVVRFKARRDE